MWIIAIAWMYVATMMAVVEATSSQGSVLGAIVTFLFYGVGPLALVMYLLGTPARRKAQRERDAQAEMATSEMASPQADAGGLPAGDAVAPERKEP